MSVLIPGNVTAEGAEKGSKEVPLHPGEAAPDSAG